MPALDPELVALWKNREWRLNNLYWIEDKFGGVVKFKLNAAQKLLLDDLACLNIILKARQLGFSTFILLMALDCALFNDHFAAGFVADTMPNAVNLLKRAKFAYLRLPAGIQKSIPITKNNESEIAFGNGSSIAAGVSLRSGTNNFVHVSEYGKICSKFPDKAKEIKAGALNTIAPGQLVFIESTADGRSGDFFDKTQAALRLRETGAPVGKMDYRFHFFPWFMDSSYRLDGPMFLNADELAYFDGLEKEHGIRLADSQKFWYAAKSREQGDDMWKEFPSTPDEAFKAAKDGAIYAKILRSLRLRGMIGKHPFVPNIAVNTFWDFGLGDLQSIWLHQEVAGQHRFVGFFEDTGEGLSHYFAWLEKWRVVRGAVWGRHYAPHDVEHRRQGLQAQSIRQIASSVGWNFTTVERTPDKWGAVETARGKLPGCVFDEAECGVGLVHLENYTREWDDKMGHFKSFPRHDEHCHAADAFQTFTDGYVPPQKGWGKPSTAWVS